MAWSTVAGLAILAALASALIRWRQGVARNNRIEALDAAIADLMQEIEKALHDEPTNLARHCRLRLELDRLCGERDTL